jgi:hypothetical protein
VKTALLFDTEPTTVTQTGPVTKTGSAATQFPMSVWETTAVKLEERTVQVPDGSLAARPDLGGCWYWVGAISSTGHGRIALQDRVTVGTHVLAWTVTNQRFVNSDQVVRHRCDEPSCVRPVHLEIGSQLDNIADRERRGRGYANTADTRGTAGRARAIRDHLLTHADDWDGLAVVLAAGDPQRHQTPLPLGGV